VPTITSIKPQKNKKRLNIYLDGKFGFGIDLENFVKLGLKVEQELSDKETIDIVKKAEFQKTFDKLLRFATLRPRSQKEIKDWLRRKKIHEGIHKELFNRLKRLEIMDDRKFALWWISQRQEFKPKGKRALSYELRAKGVGKEIIEDVLGEVVIDEEKIASRLLEKRAYRFKGLPRLKARQKMSQYLAGKGLAWEVIEKAVSKVLK
jgi:regulatory protein